VGPPAEIKTPHPDQLGGETGKRGGPIPEGRHADYTAGGLKARRALRFQAQSHAQRVLTARARATHPGKFPGDVYRTASCLWSKISAVQVHQDIEHGSAHYSGLVTCGSVWACPTCAAKIQERRRLEIEHAMTWAKAEGLLAIMPTFTFPHRSFHSLAQLLQKQAHAFRLFRQTRGYRRATERLGFRGLIRSLEVTHGANGWHPHTHELWFVGSVDGDALRDELAHLWLQACVSAGLVDAGDDHAAFLRHSVNVRSEVTAGDYLAKQDDSRSWGLAHEVAKATSKAGRATGVHPHHFLVRKGQGDDVLFLEYVEGMKGRRQLFWSPGLKAAAGVGEKSDETIAEESVERARLVMTLPPGAWAVVRGNDARAEVLDAAESGGSAAVEALLQSLGYREGEADDEERMHGGCKQPGAGEVAWPGGRC
jgi:hypothetical protein